MELMLCYIIQSRNAGQALIFFMLLCPYSLLCFSFFFPFSPLSWIMNAVLIHRICSQSISLLIYIIHRTNSKNEVYFFCYKTLCVVIARFLHEVIWMSFLSLGGKFLGFGSCLLFWCFSLLVFNKEISTLSSSNHA